MSIDWNSIGEQEFNVLDPICGFWTDDGFTRDQHQAKNFTHAKLTPKELEAIETTSCMLMSA